MVEVWVEAARPKTLLAAIAPVVIGAGLAYADGGGDFFFFMASLLFALLIQIATNFTNDYHDFVKGTDGEQRIGPRRACAAGLISPDAMYNAMLYTFVAAGVVGIALVARGGWPLLAVVGLSIWAGWAYTAGPYPLGYNGLGDLFVLIFFGPLAVGSTYFLQNLELTPEVLVLGLAPGLLSTAILSVNNIRDIDGDRKSGKMTLAVRLGRRFGKGEYIGCVVVAALIPPLAAYFFGGNGFSLLTLLVIPFAVPIMKVVITKRDGPSLNAALGETAQLLVAFTAALLVGRFL